MYRLLFLFLLAGQPAAAQHFGGFPPATRWQQINTDTARIIFAQPAREQAERVAALIHRMAADTPVAIGGRLKKINVVLHNNTTLANGYVGMAPFRSEFYLIPGSNIFEFGNLPWHENLAIHEYRHVQQYNNFYNGISKVFYFLLGQQGQALANGLSVPDWLFEGDAVYAETAFTAMGRGRQPFFLSAYNSLWQEGKDYSWQKLRNGSYKDYVPNHYPLGYLLTNYGYLQYGNGFWQQVTRDASAFKGLFYPFQKAVKRHAGIDFKSFRREALGYYRQKVGREAVTGNGDPTVTNYYFPQVIGADSLLYLKDSYRRLPAFYVRNSRGEHRIGLRSIASEEWFSYRNGTIAYAAYAANPRWSLTDYSDIVLLDVATQKERRLTHQGKFFTPDLSPDGAAVITVAMNPALGTELHLLRTDNGTLIKKIRPAGGAYFVHPRFVNDQTIVVGLRLPDGTMSWNLMNVNTGAAQELIAPAPHTIGFPFVQGDRIFFTATFNGNDDIYVTDLKAKKVFQLTAGQTGNYFPSVTGDTLLWSKFTTAGLQLQKKALPAGSWSEVNALQWGERQLLFPVAGGGTDLLAAPARNFPVSPYRKSTGLFNFHSWDPSAVSLYSNNILNTFSTELYYRYNESEDAHTGGWSASYGGWFPVINSNVSYTYNRHIRRPSGTITANEVEASLGYNIPLSFTRGKTLKGLNFGSNYVYNRLMPSGASQRLYAESSKGYLHHFGSWGQQLPRARQHIYPRLGYALSAAYRHRLDAKGYQALAGTSVYLPSPVVNHSVVLTGSFQQVDTGNVLFSNRFSLARGYPDYYNTRMWNGGFNYHLPLLYPDRGFASIVYLLRLRANLFFDYSRAYSKDKTRHSDLRSTGTELYFDTRWWNQLPVTFGVRYSHLLDTRLANGNRHVFEFIVPVGLIPN